MSADIDSLVKGAPPLGSDIRSPGDPRSTDDDGSPSPTPGIGGGPGRGLGGFKPGDPLSHTPSSPSMIYLNMLILEASLRAQYLELRTRRRHHTFFLVLLTAWTAGFGYALFLAPREDGSGARGGSVYWLVEVTEKVCFIGGLVTFALSWATGIWDRGIRWPRKWFSVTNRGLRGFNCKLVVVRRPWYAELLSVIGFYLTYGILSTTGSGCHRIVDAAIVREVDRELAATHAGHNTLPIMTPSPSGGGDDDSGGREEDLAPGGDYVRLLLLPKPFSPTFRENWDLYRTEYWERENERRALIQAKLKERDRAIARRYGGWLWFLPWRRRAALARAAVEEAEARKQAEAERRRHAHHLHVRQRHAALHEKEHRRTRSGSGSARRNSTASTTSSRSPTPTVELEDGASGESRPSSMVGSIAGGPGTVSRKASTASNASEKRRSVVGGATTKRSSGSLRGERKRAAGGAGGAGAGGGTAGTDSRSVTPEIPSPLSRESSIASTTSEAGGRDRGGASSSGGTVRGGQRPSRPAPSAGSAGPS